MLNQRNDCCNHEEDERAKEGVGERESVEIPERFSTKLLTRQRRLSSCSMNDITLENSKVDGNGSNSSLSENVYPVETRRRSSLKSGRRLSVSCENILESSKSFDNCLKNTIYISCHGMRNYFDSVDNLRSFFNFKETVAMSKSLGPLSSSRSRPESFEFEYGGEEEQCPREDMVATLQSPQPTECMDTDAARRQRIARYKEERRRQLAAQYGSHDVNSSSSGSGGASVTIRSTRASRLRSQAASADAGKTSPLSRRDSVNGEKKEVNGRLGPASPEISKEKSPLSDTSSTSSLRKDRDKSAKRKSNLNRSLNNEPVTARDSPEDALRRRRVNSVTASPTKSSTRSTPTTSTAPESDSPRSVAGRTFKRSTPPRESPRPRPRSSSALLERQGSASPSSPAEPAPSTPVVNGTDTPPATPPLAADPCLPDVVALPSTSSRPSSILKKKSLDETSSQTHISQTATNTAKPVSILKRKTSQEEGGAPVVSQPVTFSPTVLETSSRRQGILKKHCSLDEGSSGGGGLSLKQQRRKSLEEVRRHSSPEPQGILKRKTSREQAVESGVGTNEPQGILKRKSSTGSSAPVHVTIADSVILAVAGEDSFQGEDDVKSILKKKSSVCEEPPGILQDCSAQSNDPLRPILKKKSSSETEESDEKPKKPILKSRKVSEGRINFTDHEATGEVPSQNVPGVEHNEIVENLQRSEEVVCRRYSDDVPLRRNEDSRRIVDEASSSRPNEDSPSALSKRAESLSPERSRVVRRVQKSVDPEIALKRRSLDSCVRFEEKPSSSPRVRASFSVAERVMNMEAFLATEAETQRPRSLSPSGLWEGKGAVPKRTRDRERFRTQPITVEELSFSRSWSREEGEMQAATSGSHLAQEEDEERRPAPLSRSDSVSARASLFEAQLKRTEEAKPKRVLRGSAARRVKLDPSRFQTQPVTQDEVEEAKRVNEATNNSSATEEDDPNDPSKLSLAERVKLFNQKMVTERLAPKPTSRANRFKTQPVTTEEVETAKKITPISRTASSILVSGILKNLTEKNEGPKAKVKAHDTSESEDDMESAPSSPQKRGILKSPSQGLRNSISEASESETTNLRSVLKKENKKTSEVDRNSTDLHSILKVTKKGEESSSEETESDSEDDKPNANSDLIDLLHKVEAQARGERKSNSPERRKSLQPTQNHKKPDELKNLKNLEQGKENYQGDLTRRLRRRKEGELSEGDSSSSGGREVRKIINNEAVARRRQAGIAREAAERVKRYSADGSLAKSQSHSAMNGEVVLRPASMVEANPLRRCRTQPMDECDEPLTNGVSIAQRLEALQKRGQTDWKKRISRLNPEEELTTTNNINAAAQILQERLSTPVKSSPESVPSTPLDERLGLLESSTQGWKKRVAPSDATQFSVAGKMAASQVPLSPLLSPALERKKKTPKPERFRSKNTPAKKDTQSVPTSPEQEATQGVFKRSISAPGIEEKKNSSTADEVSGPLVSVPQAYDEHFSDFFTTTSAPQERLELRDEDLDNITSETSQLSVVRRTVKVNRRRGASSNPVKALAARTDLRTEYVEVKSGVAQREEKRINIERLAKNSNLAVEALAGLASQEDFSAVQLRSATSAPSAHLSTMLPYKELMLLQVKGRRHVQTRVVRPHYTSVNQGDCYVLVTPSQVYHWIGECSNVIEQSRSCEIAQHIVQTRDLGCTATQVTTLRGLVPHKQFWLLLGADKTTALSYTGVEAGHPDEDEVFELTLTDTNMIYEVEDEELVPREDYWGAIPKIEILDHNKVLVFDFGSELYVWMGKNVALDRRRTALRLGQEKWDQGFNYTDCDICPVTQAQYLGTRTENDNQEKCGSERPEWALLAKITQHMETILFREKFLDWPDFTRVIQVKSRNQEKQVDGSVDVKSCEAQPMVDWTPPEPDLELEGSHLGRGIKYYDPETHRHFEIATTGVTVWHVQEFESTEMQGSSIGQFHSGDSYVVRWCYTVTVSGRELTGAPSRHSTMGRDRCAYFTWQGRDATTNDKGAAALLTVQLDQERGPQLRLSQGQEYPAFRQLFNGGFVIHSGRRSDGFNQKCRWRLFMVLGEEEVEVMLVEVKCSIRQLRSRACLLLVDTREACVYLWRGSHAHENTCQAALAAVDRLKEQLPEEMGVKSEESLTVEEIVEGKEPKIFFEALGGHSRHLYTSLHGVSTPVTFTPRLFRFSSVSGEFTASPIAPVCHHTDSPTPFPYAQHELYSARQPALFLVDAGDTLWLWQGWWEEEKSEDSDDNSANISSRDGEMRWQAERRAGMSTTLEYARLRGVTQPAQLVWAGLEPLAFTNLFPTWTDRDDIAQLNISDGRKPGEVLLVQEELARLTRSTYPLAQLLQRPLPEGVDPTRLEVYLAPHHFQELLGMTKEEFAGLPSWKQNKIKQEKGLF